MDHRVILSVAGSGKTSFIIDSLNLNTRAIIISYTIANTESIKFRIIEKFGFLPKNIKVLTYFSFLFSFCFKPLFYRYLEKDKNIKVKGIIYSKNPNRYTKNDDFKYYISNKSYVYSNRLSKLIMELDTESIVNSRLEKYFDELYIDEIQDISGNDFNFVKKFSQLKMEVVFVGDFYQHTFNTSADGNVNRTLFDDYDKYIKKFEQAGFQVDVTTLSKSYRCTGDVCNFITKKLNIQIESHSLSNSNISEIVDPTRINELIKCKNTVKLFYKEHHKFSIYSNNWGNSKGLDCYHNICIILHTKVYKLYLENKLHTLENNTKNKLYVACTRSKNDIFFISQENFRKSFSKTNLF